MNGKKALLAAGLAAAGLLAAAGCGQETPDPTAEQVVVTVKTGQQELAGEPAANTFVDASGEAVAYEDVLTGTCTAYTDNAETATGASPDYGDVAVDPTLIPYGTRLYITAEDGSYVYGYATAVDTGAAMEDGDVLCDLYLDSEEECDDFGRREMLVYLLPDEA